MACMHPLLAVDYGVDPETGKHRIKILPRRADFNLALARSRYGDSLMMLPCNKCIACAKDYARMWQARIMCEFEYHQKACWLTLTYRKAAKPNKEDLRAFIKAVRKEFGNGIKFFGCGEKGDLTERFHNHLILFGVDFQEDRQVHCKRGLNLFFTSKKLDKLWKHGFALIGDLDVESAGYVSRYCDKKKIKGISDGEFVIMSRGLGMKYLQEQKDDILDSDFLYFKGQKFKIPRYFLKLMDNMDFNYQVYAEDYRERKRAVAQSFRYGQGRSVTYEEEGMKMDEHAQLVNHEQKGVLRDVGIY